MDKSNLIIKPVHEIYENINFCASCDGSFYKNIGYRKITIKKSIPQAIEAESSDWVIIFVSLFEALNFFYVTPMLLVSLSIFAYSMYEIFWVKTNNSTYVPLLQTTGTLMAVHIIVGATFDFIIRMCFAMRYLQLEGYI